MCMGRIVVIIATTADGTIIHGITGMALAAGIVIRQVHGCPSQLGTGMVPVVDISTITGRGSRIREFTITE